MDYEKEVKRCLESNYGIIRTAGGYHYKCPTSTLTKSWCEYLMPVPKKLAEMLEILPAKKGSDLIPARATVVFKNRQEIIDYLNKKYKEKEMNKLYEVTQGDIKKYATKLAVNSNGDWVMEEKGSNSVFTAKDTQCEEVKPYTILVRQAFQNMSNHYTAKKDEFNPGDVFVTSQGEIVTVVKVDTKQDNHKGDFKPVTRIVTEAV